MSPAPAPVRDRVTISEVARVAGVSKATVSRYIGGDRQLLADATAQRLGEVIEQLGYRPNQMARGLKRGQTRLIGMLVADILNPYSVAVMHGVETACRQHGYSLVVCNTNRDDEQERHHLRALQSYNVEGLIVNTLGHHPGELLTVMRDLPIVLVDRQLPELNADLVGLDNAHAMQQGIEHLHARGYRNILAITEPLDGTSSRAERVQALTALVQTRADMQCQVVPTGPELSQALTRFLESDGTRPKALFTLNGVATLAVTTALREAGHALFGEVGVIALDDLDWYPLVGNGITALAQPTERIGMAAFEHLLSRLHGEQGVARRIDFKASLIIRGSTHPR
ncbi:LacI family DNA-binding transcriptional regulator [Pseudomonas parafulva]|uniref:LacI family DNA-binding transcriptional regulator n=1 Tax=Pseudomonas TaxID=286 RepID=UPI0018D95231|nr:MULTISPECIES: LacI family DNA-binding transcriptional regulator [Pseudomonas]MBH3345409.1 LacI family DNA-binding transcriptional regulator [Pseudomonas parafulva]MEC4021931.1 LacI family DNA-binding transcriptional regulator [Pseudomonas fulva]